MLTIHDIKNAAHAERAYRKFIYSNESKYPHNIQGKLVSRWYAYQYDPAKSTLYILAEGQENVMLAPLLCLINSIIAVFNGEASSVIDTAGAYTLVAGSVATANFLKLQNNEGSGHQVAFTNGVVSMFLNNSASFKAALNVNFTTYASSFAYQATYIAGDLGAPNTFTAVTDVGLGLNVYAVLVMFNDAPVTVSVNNNLGITFTDVWSVS